MQAIQKNPYRTLGVLTGASTREITRQTNNLNRHIAAGAEPPADFSFSALDNFQRTVEDIDAANAKLNLDEDKMLAALFWFWKGNEITDEPAFDTLKEGDITTAYNIWDKLVIHVNEENKRFWNDVSAKNASAFHNSAVLVLLDNTLGSYVSAVMANIKFIESDYFSEFVKSTVDVTYKVSKKDIELKFLEVIINEINDKKVQTSLSQLVKYLDGYDFVAKQDFLKSISKNFTANITAQIETSRKQRTANKANAAAIGENLYKNTKDDLEQLKSIFGMQDFNYSNIADKAANEVLQCSIDYFNDSQERDLDSNYHERAEKLAKYAKNIAVGSLVKERIEDAIRTLNEMKDREISKAIQVLQSIKDAYETNKAKITAEVYAMPLGYNQSINWSKVNEMIYKSINWDKAIELAQRVIPQKNIEKIKVEKNQTKLNEYKDLVDFLISKLSYTQTNKVKYLCYWKTESTASNVVFTVKSIPIWVRWLGGIAMFLLLVAAIWGEDGLGVVFGIAVVIGVFTLLGYLNR
jgi:hypothetical protein